MKKILQKPFFEEWLLLCIYSLVETARMNGLNVYDYLHQLLLYMLGYIAEPEGMEDMLPWPDSMQAACSKIETVNPEVQLKS